MSSLKGGLMGFLRDESGASLVEYTLLIGLITIAVITAVITVGGKIGGLWSKLASLYPST